MRIAVIGALLIGCAGCESVFFGPASEALPPLLLGPTASQEEPSASIDASRVRILEGKANLPCVTQALGPIEIQGASDDEAAFDEMRMKAAALQAEAVTGVGWHPGNGGADAAHYSGMAVRCQDLVQGRAFDVVGELEVAEDPGDEVRAFAALRAKGRDLHADLVVDTALHAGGSGRRTRLTGTAIRFREGGSAAR